MKRDALRRLPSDGRKTAQLVDQALEIFGREGHGGRPAASSRGRARGSNEGESAERTGHAVHGVAHQLFGTAARLVHGGEDQVLEHGDIAGLHDFGIDLDGDQFAATVGSRGHHAAAGRRLDALFAQLLLHLRHLGLHLLRLLHESGDVFHGWAPPESAARRAISPSNHTIACCTSGETGASPGAVGTASDGADSTVAVATDTSSSAKAGGSSTEGATITRGALSGAAGGATPSR